MVKKIDPNACVILIKIPSLEKIKLKLSLYFFIISVRNVKTIPIWKPLQKSIVHIFISDNLMNNVSGVRRRAPKKAIMIPFVDVIVLFIDYLNKKFKINLLQLF